MAVVEVDEQTEYVPAMYRLTAVTGKLSDLSDFSVMPLVAFFALLRTPCCRAENNT